jgi:hypothetical protein
MGDALIHQESKFSPRVLATRIVRASIKTAVVYGAFFVLSMLMAPLEGIFNYHTLSTPFLALYIFFIFIVELARGTVFQHIFSIAGSLMMVFYFFYFLDQGIVRFPVEQFEVMIDLKFFLSLFVLGGLLSFAKSMLSFVHWVNEREEVWLRLYIK